MNSKCVYKCTHINCSDVVHIKYIHDMSATIYTVFGVFTYWHCDLGTCYVQGIADQILLHFPALQ